MKKFLIFIILSAVCLLGRLPKATAQPGQPRFLITWKTNSFVPAGFNGKILPAANSIITASFELVEGGKLADLSRQPIYWYLNNNLIENKEGVQRIVFLVTGIAGDSLTLRIQVPNYRQGNTLLKTIEIPIARPEAVIEAPFPNGEFHNSPIQLRARPYFFNVGRPENLTFSWKVNGNPPQSSEEPEVLNIVLNKDAPNGAQVTVDLTIQNPLNIFEGALRSINLTYTK
jgi:hypothetical protein